MKKLIVFWMAMFIGVFSVVSCSKEAKPEGVIPAQQLDALKKAKEVEGLLQKADQERKEIIE